MQLNEHPATEADLWSRWATRILALFTLLLIVSTWPMWWGTEAYPTIPLFNALHAVPLALDRMLAAGLCCASLGLCVTPACWHGRLLPIFVFTLGFSCLLDQHRLQPWAWMFWLEAVALLTMRPREARRWIGWLVISIYFWSAVSKLDAAFVSGRGPWLLEGLLQAIDLDPVLMARDKAKLVAWLLPGGELLVACGLAVTRWRTAAVWGAAAMHLALLLALGPLGHDHHAGVLLWNGCFLIQNVLLFRCDRVPSGSTTEVSSPVGIKASRNPRLATMGRIILGIAGAAPVLEPFGLYDHWPAWAVYSDRPEIVRVFIRDEDRRRMPAHLPVASPAPLSDWCEVRLDEWSFRTCSCPVYPQARYRLALARFVSGRISSDEGVKVIMATSPNRWTGRRIEQELVGREVLSTACARFWLGTRSR